jgi:hypothetical protein
MTKRAWAVGPHHARKPSNGDSSSISAIGLRHRQVRSFCRKHAVRPNLPHVLGCRAPVWQRPSSGRPRTVELRQKARGVCVARWYDPGTGQFTTVDPDLAETDQPYAYAGDDPVDESDPTGDAASSALAFATRSFDGLASNGLGNGYYISVLTPQSIVHLQKHVHDLETFIKKFYGYDPGYDVIWFYFKEATAGTLVSPVRIEYQSDYKSYLYQGPFVFENSSHTATRTVQWYVAVNEYSEYINTIFFTTQRSRITSASVVAFVSLNCRQPPAMETNDLGVVV